MNRLCIVSVMRAEKVEALPVSMDDLLEDFDPKETAAQSALTRGASITVWLSAEDRARYTALRSRYGRKVPRKAREAIVALLDAIERLAS